jgi:phage terminase large subunit-like protein
MAKHIPEKTYNRAPKRGGNNRKPEDRFRGNASAWSDEELLEKPHRKFMRRIYIDQAQHDRAERRAIELLRQENDYQTFIGSGIRNILLEYYKIVQTDPVSAEKALLKNKSLADMLARLPHNPIFMYEPFDTDRAVLQDGNIKSSPLLFHQDPSHIRVVVTGNRCSKTYSGAADVISHCLGIDPVTKERIRNHVSQPYWVVSDTEDASKQIVQATYAALIPQDYLRDSSEYTVENGWKGNRITFRNGSQIEFRFSSQGRATFQGTYRNIHLDEEPPKDIYTECYARTTPVGGRPRGRIVITFTPIYNPRVGISWIQTDLYARRHQIRGLSFHFWTLWDVPDYIIPHEEKVDLISGYDEDERDVRALGLFTPVGMQLAFSRELIAEQRQKAGEITPDECIIETEDYLVKKPVREVKFAPEGSDLPFTSETRKRYIAKKIEEGESPEVVVFIHPIDGRRYAIGADPAEGLAHGDDSCASVIDRDTLEQVAIIQGKLDPDEFGDLLDRVGRYYNNAYIGVENVADLTPIYALSRAEYPNLHYQCVIDGRVYDKQTDKIGWSTNVRTRRILRNDALQMLRDGSATIYSHALLDQMEIFARNAKGRWEAIQGGHDDMVMAWMIALQMAKCADIVDDWRDEGLLSDDANINTNTGDPIQNYVTSPITQELAENIIDKEFEELHKPKPKNLAERIIDRKLHNHQQSEVGF